MSLDVMRSLRLIKNGVLPTSCLQVTYKLPTSCYDTEDDTSSYNISRVYYDIPMSICEFPPLTSYGCCVELVGHYNFSQLARQSASNDLRRLVASTCVRQLLYFYNLIGATSGDITLTNS